MYGSKLRSQSSTTSTKTRQATDTGGSRLFSKRSDYLGAKMACSSEDPLRDSFAVHSLDSDTVATDSQGHHQHSVEPANLKDRKHENSTSPNAAGPPAVPQASSTPNKPSPPSAISRGPSPRPWSLDGRGQRCTVKGCVEPPSYSFDGRRPAVRCGNHRETKMYRVEHVDKTCGEKGCERPAQVSFMSQDGKIGRFCSEHKAPAIIPSSAAHCQYKGCSKQPKYGTKQGPLRFCGDHKRSGMFTHRKGQLMVATRDGSAFRNARESNESIIGKQDPLVTQNVSLSVIDGESAATSTVVTEKASNSQEAPKTATRKLCQVSGCEVQPSYGIKGTRKAIFCTNHKKEGMVALKNRPCIFEGCDTRPHYGVAGGRPLYCAHHMKPGMVHVLKYAYNTMKQEAARKRAASKQKREGEKKKSGVDSKHVKHSESKTAGTSSKNQPGRGRSEDSGRRDGTESRRQVAGARKAVKDSTVRRGTRQDSSSPAPEQAPSLSSSRSTTAPTVDNQVPSKTAAKSKSTTTAAEEAVQRSNPASAVVASPAKTSAEVRTLQAVRESARESAKVAAMASGSGRRPRAPSLKALEASGLATAEGAQLMTKEMKEEEARKAKEFKELRRAIAAARRGSRKVPEGSSPRGSDLSGSRGSGTVSAAAKGTQPSRKMALEEALPQSRRGSLAKTGTNVRLSGDKTTGVAGVADGVADDPLGSPSHGTPASSSMPAAFNGRPTTTKRGRAKSAEDAGHGNGEGGQHKNHKVQQSTDGEVKRRRGAADNHSATRICLSKDCSKVATHGVNNSERYCKEHCLFGMYEIAHNG